MNPLLFELQEIDNRIARIKRERGKLDDGESLRSERDTLQKAVTAEKDRLSHLNTDRTDKELQLSTTEEKITKQQTRLMNAKSAHEVNSLQRDIEGLGHARGDLDEALLMLMDEIETCSNRLVELQKELEEKSAETGGIEAQFATDAARLDDELATAMKERTATAEQLNPGDRERYDSEAKRHHGIAVAHLEKGNCSACGTAITPFNLREAKMQEWPTCENCGRLLFIAE